MAFMFSIPVSVGPASQEQGNEAEDKSENISQVCQVSFFI